MSRSLKKHTSFEILRILRPHFVSNSFPRILVIAFILLLSAFPAFANEPDNIGEIIVEADPVEEDTIPDKPTSSGKIIDLEKYRKQFIELKDLLSIEPGIHTRDFSGPGHMSTVNIRGVSSKGVLVMIDGVPLNGLWSRGVNLASFPLNSFEKVEVLKGGGGAFYGDIALGGAINLVTGGRKRNSFTFTVGSDNLFESNSLMSFPGENGDLMIALEGKSARGDFSFTNNNGTFFDDRDDFTDTRINNEIDSLGLLFKYSNASEKGLQQSIVVEFFKAREGVPGLTTFPTPNAQQEDSRVFIQTEMRKQNVLPFTDADFRFFYRGEVLDYEDKSGEGTGSPVDTHRTDDLIGLDTGFTNYDENGMGLTGCSFSLSHEIFKQNDAITRGRSKGSISLEREQYFDDGDIVLHGSSRLDLIDGFDPRISFRIGSSYFENENLEIRANGGNSFRVPAFDEMYENRGFVIGNSNLVPEKGLDFDIGFIYRKENANLGVTFFHNKLRDQIVYELISGFRYKPFNVGKTDLTGFELSTKREFNDFDFVFNYTWLDARNRTDDPATKGKKLPSRPEHELFAQVVSKYEKLNFEIDYSYASGNYITFANTTELKDRSRMDFRLKWNKDDWSVTGEIRNILGEDLVDIRGFPLPGRTFFLTLSHEY